MRLSNKIISVLFLFAVISFSACFKTTCEDEETKANTVYLFIDYTDQMNFEHLKKNWETDYKNINKLFPMQPCQGGKLRIIPISNLGSNEIAAMSYEALSPSLNEFNPPIDYTLFKRDFKKSMEGMLLKDAKELPSTHLFEPMCNAFNQLQNATHSGRKIAIFYSDMLENSDGGSMYRKNGNMEQLLANWSANTGCDLPDLDGIEIYIVNHRKEDTNELIRAANLFWKETFSETGAEVHLGSSLEL